MVKKLVHALRSIHPSMSEKIIVAAFQRATNVSLSHPGVGARKKLATSAIPAPATAAIKTSPTIDAKRK